MLKVKLPNGVEVEGDSPRQVAEMLDLLGYSPRGGQPTPVPAPVSAVSTALAAMGVEMMPGRRLRTRPRSFDVPHWTPEIAGEFLQSLPSQTRRLLICLLELEAASTAALAHRLDLSDSKPIGSMLSSIRRRAEQIGRPNPVISQLGDEESPVRVVRLELQFRDAASRHYKGAE